MKRREFLGGLMSGVVAASDAAMNPTSAWAENSRAATSGGATHSLSIAKRVLDVNGKAADVFGLVQSDGSVGLTLDADSPFDVTLSNDSGEATLIHWHGLTPLWHMDGVPDNPAALLKAAETRRYKFPVGSGGTHWMHAHTLQEQNLLAAPLIVRTADERKLDEHCHHLNHMVAGMMSFVAYA
ncbi:FtsP/CotA-like multicopper oxidase with cupredoxin domain [Sinorhizobium kostiense]|uniref:FtsP/CotA-like multicopper oxidase with cupredoxin domain n=1 Tax=Sinorhizobium kostiense TaxID=76747 RepID=A0ABS4R5J3_9HYPH|nr:FtsP/CotA-like multicopper oxidase with cupredoxin domain [Sinorhizobium kostiense]